MIIDRFGVHTAPGDVSFLIQMTGAQNLISPNLPSPFELHIRPKGARCPHDIDLSDHAPAPDWASHPLIQMLSPTPGFMAGWVHGGLELVETLTQLSAPVGVVSRPIWTQQSNGRKAIYGITNIGPVIWSLAEVRHTHEAYAHFDLAQAAGRKVLVVAKDKLPMPGEIELFNPGPAPLRQIGAGMLRFSMAHA